MNNQVSPDKTFQLVAPGGQLQQGYYSVAIAPQESNITNSPQITLTDWDVDLFDCSEDRLFTWCCANPALAMSRSYIDGSECCFNICCIPPPVTICLIHSAYGIPFTKEHAFQACCCTNCYINRVYQTAKRRGNPNPQFRGKGKNTQKLNHPDCPTCVVSYCCLSAWCPFCYSWYKLRQHLNMPVCIGCCTCPWTAGNLLRYQYGIEGLS